MIESKIYYTDGRVVQDMESTIDQQIYKLSMGDVYYSMCGKRMIGSVDALVIKAANCDKCFGTLAQLINLPEELNSYLTEYLEFDFGEL